VQQYLDENDGSSSPHHVQTQSSKQRSLQPTSLKVICGELSPRLVDETLVLYEPWSDNRLVFFFKKLQLQNEETARLIKTLPHNNSAARHFLP
jgi:hypothetical protein